MGFIHYSVATSAECILKTTFFASQNNNDEMLHSCTELLYSFVLDMSTSFLSLTCFFSSREKISLTVALIKIYVFLLLFLCVATLQSHGRTHIISLL